MPEPVEIRLQRKRLEQELANIENLCAPHQLIHRKLKDTQKSIRLTERNKLPTEQVIEQCIFIFVCKLLVSTSLYWLFESSD